MRKPSRAAYLENLSDEEIQFLSSALRDLYLEIKKAAEASSERTMTKRLIRKRAEMVAQCPRRVATLITYGHSLESAVAKVADAIGTSQDAVLAAWNRACRQARGFEAATRDQAIYRMMRAGRSNAEIAAALHVHPSSIGRIKRRILGLRLAERAQPLVEIPWPPPVQTC